MKKTILFLVTLFALKLTAIAQQQKEISIHCVFPKKLNAGDKVNLKVNVSHTLYKEQTGNLTLELIDATTNKSVDGWFLNIFPFQYFTSIKGENFETQFPFTIPSDYHGKCMLTLKAVCGDAKDSLSHTFTIGSKIVNHE